jgi:anti-sigma B factor antagonist
MDITVEDVAEDIAIVRPSGRLNMVTAALVRETIVAAIAEGRPRVVVDLGRIEFIDSTGLGALIGSLKSTRQAGGDLRIARPTAQVQMILSLSNLDRILTAYATPEEAFDA